MLRNIANSGEVAYQPAEWNRQYAARIDQLVAGIKSGELTEQAAREKLALYDAKFWNDQSAWIARGRAFANSIGDAAANMQRNFQMQDWMTQWCGMQPGAHC
jgi:hypothetical protein